MQELEPFVNTTIWTYGPNCNYDRYGSHNYLFSIIYETVTNVQFLIEQEQSYEVQLNGVQNSCENQSEC